MTTVNPKLVQLVETVNKVHGPSHPHLAEVKETFTRITNLDDAAEIRVQLAHLRELSNDYRTPADGCEGYRMMDAQLEEFEKDVLTRLGA